MVKWRKHEEEIVVGVIIAVSVGVLMSSAGFSIFSSYSGSWSVSSSVEWREDGSHQNTVAGNGDLKTEREIYYGGIWDRKLTHVGIPNLPYFYKFTVMVLTKHHTPNDGDPDVDICCYGSNAFLMRDLGDGTMQGKISNGFGWSRVNVSMPTETWYLWTLRWDGDLLKLIRNDFESSDSVSGAGNANRGQSADLGWRADTSDSYLDGNQALVLVWDTDLTDTEIQNVYDMVQPLGSDHDPAVSELPQSSSIVRYYNFAEGSGTTLGDLAGANDGTINNGAWDGTSTNGRWTSRVWDSGASKPQQISSFEANCTIGADEYVIVRIGVDEDDDGTIDTWSHASANGVNLSDGTNTLEDSDFNLPSGYHYQVEYQLSATDTDPSHTPTVQDYTLSVIPAGPETVPPEAPPTVSELVIGIQNDLGDLFGWL